MKIGELAGAAGTQSETIRYYERQGLLPVPARSDGNYRIYDQGYVRRLAFIRHCRSLDMTLDEIRTLLLFKDAPAENCAAVNELLDEHIGHVASRIRELKTLEKELRGLREQCVAGQDAARCGILTGLETAARDQHRKPEAHGQGEHVSGTHQRVGVASSKAEGAGPSVRSARRTVQRELSPKR